MNFFIIVGLCLTAAAAVPRNTEYTDTTAVQRSYSSYDPYYREYDLGYYNCRPPYYYPYYYETPSYSCYHKMYYNPYNYNHYYNPYYNYYRPPYYYNSGSYYGSKAHRKGDTTDYRSSYGHSGHEANYNVPLYYAPGYQQGYQTYADDHPYLHEQYNRPEYMAHNEGDAKYE